MNNKLCNGFKNLVCGLKNDIKDIIRKITGKKKNDGANGVGAGDHSQPTVDKV